MLARYHDAAGGGFFFTSHDHEDLLARTNAAAGRPLRLTLVREQKAHTVALSAYTWAAAESPAGRDFKAVRLAPATGTVAIRAVGTRPGTANEPPAMLHDGRLAENYGPVFRNGVAGGLYRVDLGRAVPVASVSTWSYNQNGGRGPQHFVLYGSGAEADPGWAVGDRKRFVPIAEVDTTGMRVETFHATRIQRAGGGALGAFRWLVWAVYPVTRIGENTAYQEFQVVRAD